MSLTEYLDDPFGGEPEDFHAEENHEYPELLTAEQVREIILTCSPDAIRALREAGVLPPSETFRVETPEHVDWYAWRLLENQRESAAIQARAAERVAAIQRDSERLQALYAADAQRIVAQLVASQKKGKSVKLDRITAKLRTVAGGPKVTDEAAVLEFILANHDAGRSPLVDAVKVSRTETFTGQDAIWALERSPEEWTPKVYAIPVKEYVKALPGTPDPETGEVVPATIPGVEIEPASERLSFE